MGYAGSEEFIRLQFEEYLLALLSAVKYKLYTKSVTDSNAVITDIDGDPSDEFNADWIEAWMKTENFRLFNKFTGTLNDAWHICSCSTYIFTCG
jgi:hypothetical protein